MERRAPATKTELRCHLYLPPRPQRPLLVLAHGVTTRPERLIAYAAPLAARFGVPLLAPDFSGPGYSGFQKLSANGRAMEAARALSRAVERTRRQNGLASGPFDLMGFSAGAQFAHRFAICFPDQVRRAVVASAGWYTYLDPRLAYPQGIARLGGHTPSTTDAFLRLPMLVAVGDQDTGRGRHFRNDPDVDRRQGVHRLERARRWFKHLSQEAARRGIKDQFEFRLLSGVGHSLKQAILVGDMMSVSFEFLMRPDSRTTATATTSDPFLSALDLNPENERLKSIFFHRRTY